MNTLKSLADKLEDYARQIRSIAEIIRTIEEEWQARLSTEDAEEKEIAKIIRSIEEAPRGPRNEISLSVIPSLPWQPLPSISDKLITTAPTIELHAAPIVEPLDHDALVQRILSSRKEIRARAIEGPVTPPSERRKSRRSRLMRYLRW